MIIKVDLSDVANIYFGRRFRIEIYNRRSSLYSADIINRGYWSTTFSISTGNYLSAGIYEVFLYAPYSVEFTGDCSSYHRFMQSSPVSISQIILEKEYLQLHYYGKNKYVLNIIKVKESHIELHFYWLDTLCCLILQYLATNLD